MAPNENLEDDHVRFLNKLNHLEKGNFDLYVNKYNILKYNDLKYINIILFAYGIVIVSMVYLLYLINQL